MQDTVNEVANPMYLRTSDLLANGDAIRAATSHTPDLDAAPLITVQCHRQTGTGKGAVRQIQPDRIAQILFELLNVAFHHLAVKPLVYRADVRVRQTQCQGDSRDPLK